MAIMRWLGNKTRHLDAILPRLPSRCETFVEPMCGTAAVGLAMAGAGRCERLVLADVNARLVNLLQTVQTTPTSLVVELAARAAVYNGELDQQPDVYADWCAELNEGTTGLRNAALMLLTNVTTFNALYRENASGRFNAPWGKRRAVNFELLAANVRETHHQLNLVETTIECVDYRKLMVSGADVCYFVDSPYDDTFGSYSANKWGPTEQVSLALHLKNLSRGAVVFATNSDTPRVRALYNGCNMSRINGQTSVSCKNEGRGGQPELLIEVRP